ncbi:glycosyltransferase [Nitrospirota bacterium]
MPMKGYIFNCWGIQQAADMINSLSGLRFLHVAALAEVIVHFKIPLLDMISTEGAVQSIYCSDEQYSMSREDSYREGGHLRKLMDLGYDINVGPVTRRPSLRTLVEIVALSRHIRRAKYDVVIAHQTIGSMLAMPAALLAGTPVKMYFSGGLRVVTSTDRLINKYGEQLLINLSDAIMLNNLEDYEYVLKLKGGKRKAHLVGAMEGCGIDTAKISPQVRMADRPGMRHKLGLADKEKVIGYVGRLVWEKGIQDLIEGASILNRRMPGQKLRYLLIGAGPDAQSIKNRVRSQGLSDQFIFTGYRFDFEKYLAASDFFALPSYREGMPTALLQAMAMGLPCVASNVRGSRELISDGQNGLLVDSNKPEELAAALTVLMGDPLRAQVMGSKARETVKSSYSREILLSRTMDTLRDVIGKALA